MHKDGVGQDKSEVSARPASVEARAVSTGSSSPLMLQGDAYINAFTLLQHDAQNLDRIRFTLAHIIGSTALSPAEKIALLGFGVQSAYNGSGKLYQ